MELQKLSTAVGERGTIETTTVSDLVGSSREEKAWELQSAVLSGHPASVLRVIEDILLPHRDTERRGLLILMAWSLADLLRKLHAGSRMLAAGIDERSIARELKLWGSGRDNMLHAARQTPPALLARLLADAIHTDACAKSGVGDSRRNLEILSLQITESLN